MGDFSPCESLDSPLFDINKERLNIFYLTLDQSQKIGAD